MGQVKTYDPKKVMVIVGSADITGFAEGASVSVEELTDGITSHYGMDGDVARSMPSDPRHRVTLTLMQTSASNDVLTAIHAADRNTGKGIIPVLIKDGSGRTHFSTAEAWIVKYANVSLATTAEEGREWVLDTGSGVLFVGGNN